MFSLIIPIYKNEANLDHLLEEMVKSNERMAGELEIVFVVDGSPDLCYEILQRRLSQLQLRSQLLLLSRNFGSFAAVTAGLEAARGDFFAVLAADLQEPPELAEQFFRILEEDQADVVFGTRKSRSDSLVNDLTSNVFWAAYRRFVVKDMPRGGVDVFGCNRMIRDRLLQFHENNTNLIALLFWIGYRRAYIPYERRSRTEGKSAWTLKKKVQYSINSIFDFTDLPIQLLLYSG
ncbi:MAG: glycosyltransferase, partial [Acidobacteriota bacterium]|nr:glycosyltransferase [Acidobacteriota bacterium]